MSTPITFREEVILNPMERMRILVDSAKIKNDVINNIPIFRYYKSLDDMFRIATIYVQEGQLEKAFVLFVRFVSMAVEELPKHKDFVVFNSEERVRAESMVATAIVQGDQLKTRLAQLYDIEALRLYNDLAKDSSITDILAENYKKRNEKNLAQIVKEAQAAALLRKNEKPEVHEKTLAVPSDLVEKFMNALGEGEEETVGILFGLKTRVHYFVVSHVVVPPRSHTVKTAAGMHQEMTNKLQASLGLIPLGLIHLTPSSSPRSSTHTENSPSVSSPTTSSSTQRTKYLPSTTSHLYAQAAYQTYLPEAISIMAVDGKDYSSFTLTPAGMLMASRHSLRGNDAAVSEAGHVKYAESLSTTIIDLRDEEKMEEEQSN